MKLFSVRDVKGDSFSAPQSVVNRNTAIRGFCEACMEPGPLSKYPNDYSLYEIGEWEPNSGTVVGRTLPEYIMSAAEAIASVNASRIVHEPVLPVEGVSK